MYSAAWNGFIFPTLRDKLQNTVHTVTPVFTTREHLSGMSAMSESLPDKVFSYVQKVSRIGRPLAWDKVAAIPAIQKPGFTQHTLNFCPFLGNSAQFCSTFTVYIIITQQPLGKMTHVQFFHVVRS